MSNENYYYKAEELKPHLPPLMQMVRDIFPGVIWDQASKDRSNALWRGGDNPTSVHYKEDACYDFKEKKGHDIFSILEADRGMGFADALTYLGDRYAPHLRHERHTQPAAAKTAAPMPPLPRGAASEPAAKKDVCPEAEFTGCIPSPAPAPKRKKTAVDLGEKVAEYTYTEADGTPVLHVERYEREDGSKIFRQYNCQEHRYGHCEGIRIIYNLPALAKFPDYLPHEGYPEYAVSALYGHPAQKFVYIVEGEKCADCLTEAHLCATTNPGGAKKWHPEYSKHFEGKDVIIMGDNDEPGHAHAEKVAQDICRAAKSVRILFPSDDPKGDIVDVYNAIQGNNKLDGIYELIKAKATVYEPPRLGFPTPEQLKMAKALNTKPLTNYIETEEGCEEDDGKKNKPKTLPKDLQDLQSEISARLLGFPASNAGVLFDFDRQKKELTYLYRDSELIAWLSVKTGHNVRMMQGIGYATKTELYSSLLKFAPKYDRVCSYIEWPKRNDTFYMPCNVPKVTGTEHFDKLLSFFSPETKEDATMIKALFMTPIWSEIEGTVPMFVIRSNDMQASGKTTLVNMLAYLYSKSRSIQTEKHKENVRPENFENFKKDLCSSEAQLKRLLIFDNITGRFDNDQLATMITTHVISARPAYGRAEMNRKNDLIYIVTTNDIAMSMDMLSRSMTILLVKPQKYPGYERMVCDYIDEYRDVILEEIRQYLDKFPRENLDVKKDIDPTGEFRFMDWARAILMPAAGGKGSCVEIIKKALKNNIENDATLDRAAELVHHVEDALAKISYDLPRKRVFIPSRVLDRLCHPLGWNTSVAGFIRSVVGRPDNPCHACFENNRWSAKDNKNRSARGVFWNQGEKESPTSFDATLQYDSNGNLIMIARSYIRDYQ